MRKRLLAACPLSGCFTVFTLICGIAAEELPRELGRIEVLQIAIVGGEPPIGVLWHYFTVRYATQTTRDGGGMIKVQENGLFARL